MVEKSKEVPRAWSLIMFQECKIRMMLKVIFKVDHFPISNC